MKTKFGISQFFSQNTPQMAQDIGNLALIIAALGITIMSLPATMAASGIEDFVLPIFLLKAAKICTVIGVIGKTITKMLGTVNNNGIAINPEQPK